MYVMYVLMYAHVRRCTFQSWQEAGTKLQTVMLGFRGMLQAVH